MLVGPGGAGKGTVAARLVAQDPQLWLSRSWTTRPRRDGEREDAYVFVGRDEFLANVDAGGFLEFTEFMGQLYGTPVPRPPPGRDVLLDIDLDGARQIADRYPRSTVVVLLVPPSPDVQERRMLERGDPPDQVRRRVDKGREELEAGRRLSHREVVNDQVERAVAEVEGILVAARSDRRALEEERQAVLPEAIRSEAAQNASFKNDAVQDDAVPDRDSPEDT